MGDDDTTVIVEPTPVPTVVPDAATMWRELLEAKHSEHMAHMDTLRAEFASMFESLSSRIDALDQRVFIQEITEPVIESGTTMQEALNVVEQVGEVIAEVTEAVNEPNVETVPTAPSGQTHDDSADTELEPDTSQENTGLAPPANSGRSRRSFW